MHGHQCPECARQLRSAMQLKALLGDLAEEVNVPLKAQAGWRAAVREEARRRKALKLRRRLTAVAAAAVILAGAGLSISRIPRADAPRAMLLSESAPAAEEERANEAVMEIPAEDVPLELSAEASSAVVEADGVAPVANDGDLPQILSEASEEAGAVVATANGAAAGRSPAFEWSLKTDDVTGVCDRILDLADEYEAKADVREMEGGAARIYVEIDASNAGDFLNAISLLDGSAGLDRMPSFAEAGSTLVLVTVSP